MKKIADLEFKLSTNEIMVLEATRLESSWQRAQAEIERYRPMENNYNAAEVMRKKISQKFGYGDRGDWQAMQGRMDLLLTLAEQVAAVNATVTAYAKYR